VDNVSVIVGPDCQHARFTGRSRLPCRCQSIGAAQIPL